MKTDKETTSLEIATVFGFEIVVRKESMKVGDTVFYIPIDSVLPEDLEMYGPNLPICQIQEIFVILGEEKANALFERVNRQLLNKAIETICIAMEEENENR